MAEYKVLIPTAGIGSRLGNHCDHVNKTLVPVANRPIISYIIEKFPQNVELIIDLGHKGELVKEFLTLAYPDRKFTFIWAKRKGLTADLCDYKDMLQCPFIFYTNDAIVKEDIPVPDHDWIGFSNIRAGNDYRSIVIDSWDSSVIKNVGEKGVHTEAGAYIGICGINDYKTFWKEMENALHNGTKNQGESFALAKMVNLKSIKGVKFTWYDTGTLEALGHANKVFSSKSDPNILPKTHEHIWFCNERVIKFSTDQEFIQQRVCRAENLCGYIPKIENHTRNMYSYKKINGRIFSDTITVPRFKQFMQWIETLWIDSPENLLTQYEKNKYLEFYRDKTFKRVQKYFRRFGCDDSSQYINGIFVPPIMSILNQIDWQWIADGKPVLFHGDLHIENILDTDKSFCLLDWRQNFGGLKDYGDLYYDLAKLSHGLIVSHDIIRKNLYKINIDGQNVSFDLLRKQILIECENWFKQYLISNNYDYDKVEIITALIFLNIAVLHHQPYAEMLFHLGKLMLYQLEEKYEPI